MRLRVAIKVNNLRSLPKMLQDLLCGLGCALSMRIGAEDELFEAHLVVLGQLRGCLIGGAYYGGA